MPKPTEIQISEKSKVVVSSDDEILDIRFHVKTAKYEGPTAKGVRLPQDPELLKALRLAIKHHDRNK